MDRQAYVDAVIERGDEAAACEQIREAARALERAGADLVVITCNGVHRFLPGIAPSVAIPFLHIAGATAEAALVARCRTAGLIGVRKTMEGEFGYRNDKGLVSLTRGAVVAGYRGIEHAAERQGARHAGQEGDAQG